MQPTILVTGATGNIGSTLVRLLADRGIPVRAAVRSTTAASFPAGVTTIPFQAEEIDSVRQALVGIERLFLLVPFVEQFDQIGVPIVQAAREAGVQRIVRLSALGAGPLGLNIGQWHSAIDEATRTSGCEWTILRPSFFMQNLSGYLSQSIKATGMFHQATADGKAAFIDTRDIAAVAVEALLADGHAGKTYTLTGGKALSYGEIAAMIATASGRSVTFSDISPEQARTGMEQQQYPQWLMTAMLGLMQLIKSGKAAMVSPTVETILGRPPVTFEQFAADHADRWR